MDIPSEQRAETIGAKIRTFLGERWQTGGLGRTPRVIYMNPEDLLAVMLHARTTGDWPRVIIETDYGTVALAASQFQAPGTFVATKG